MADFPFTAEGTRAGAEAIQATRPRVRASLIEVREINGRTTLFGPFTDEAEARRLADNYTKAHKFSTSAVAKVVPSPRSADAFRSAWSTVR